MVRRIASFSTLIGLLAVPVAAQHVEASVSGGYTASEGISVEDRDILGAFYDQVDIVSGGSFTATVGGYANPWLMFEFLYGRQWSKLRAEGFAGQLDISDVSVDNYHGNLVYHWGSPTALVRPFAFGGLGATHYSFGELQLPNGGNLSVDGNTQFSTTWGGGVKLYFTPAVGAKLSARWTPTYIKSDAEGYWCDPFYGCWVVGDPDYSHQFDISGGLTFRF